MKALIQFVFCITVIIQATLGHAYSLGSPYTGDNFNFTSSGGISFEIEEDCSFYSQGVVRGWFLEVKNKADFYRSYLMCRQMTSQGQLDSGYERVDHFDLQGSGTTVKTQIPMESLPMGVMISYKYPMIGKIKIVDINLLYQSANKIADGTSSYVKAGWATQEAGSYSQVLLCKNQGVLSGIAIRSGLISFSNTQEIYGIQLQCRKLNE